MRVFDDDLQPQPYLTLQYKAYLFRIERYLLRKHESLLEAFEILFQYVMIISTKDKKYGCFDNDVIRELPYEHGHILAEVNKFLKKDAIKVDFSILENIDEKDIDRFAELLDLSIKDVHKRFVKEFVDLMIYSGDDVSVLYNFYKFVLYAGLYLLTCNFAIHAYEVAFRETVKRIFLEPVEHEFFERIETARKQDELYLLFEHSGYDPKEVFIYSDQFLNKDIDLNIQYKIGNKIDFEKDLKPQETNAFANMTNEYNNMYIEGRNFLIETEFSSKEELIEKLEKRCNETNSEALLSLLSRFNNLTYEQLIYIKKMIKGEK